MESATFYGVVTFDRSQMTLEMLDNIVEVLRERGYPIYEPQASRIVVRYEVDPVTDPMTVLVWARDEALLPERCSYEARVAAKLAVDAVELRRDVECEVESYGNLEITWGREPV